MRFKRSLLKDNQYYKTLTRVRHCMLNGYTARVSTADWRRMLLQYETGVIVDGYPRKIVAKKIGPGVYELSLAPME